MSTCACVLRRFPHGTKREMKKIVEDITEAELTSRTMAIEIQTHTLCIMLRWVWPCLTPLVVIYSLKLILMTETWMIQLVRHCNFVRSIDNLGHRSVINLYEATWVAVCVVESETLVTLIEQ